MDGLGYVASRAVFGIWIMMSWLFGLLLYQKLIIVVQFIIDDTFTISAIGAGGSGEWGE